MCVTEKRPTMNDENPFDADEQLYFILNNETICNKFWLIELNGRQLQPPQHSTSYIHINLCSIYFKSNQFTRHSTLLLLPISMRPNERKAMKSIYFMDSDSD